MRLSERLERVLSLVEGDVMADIGCDHGKLALEVIRRNRVQTVYATDISAPSLAKAALLAEEHGANERMIVLGGDGLNPLKPYVDTFEKKSLCVVIAGMGGDEIARIVRTAPAFGRICSFVLCPHTRSDKVRDALTECGYAINYDSMLCEERKYYDVIRAVSACGKSDEEQPPKLTDRQYRYGLNNVGNPVFIECAKLRLQMFERMLIQTGEGSENAKSEINAKREFWKGALEYAEDNG